MKLLYPYKKQLFAGALTLSLLFWVGSIALAYIAVSHFPSSWGWPKPTPEGLIIVVCAALIVITGVHYVRKLRQVAMLRGHAVNIGENQFPDLFRRLKSVCKRLDIETLPSVYLFHRPLLAGSTSVRLGGKDFLALGAETVGALTDRQSAIDFLMGYELAHLHDPYEKIRFLLWPATIVPLLGPALERAKVFSYDHAGIMACKTKVDAAFAIAILAAGSRRWKSLNIAEFAGQSNETSQFMMAINELLSRAPWLPKRMAQLRAIATDSDAFVPRRHPMAFVAAAFIPYLRLSHWTGVLHILLLLLWVMVVAYWGEQAWLQIEPRLLLPTTGVDTGKSSGGKATKKPETKIKGGLFSMLPEDADPYAALDDDLKQLGKLARTRNEKYGDNPCEGGNIRGLKLNFKLSRYAYSCDEPLVYTRIEYGEFESGKQAYFRYYDWKKEKLVQKSKSGTSQKKGSDKTNNVKARPN